MNPNGLVPTIKDGDFVLWESNSIMRYLNAKYGNGKLLPATLKGWPTPIAGWTGSCRCLIRNHRAAVFRHRPHAAGKARSPSHPSRAREDREAWQTVEDHLAKEPCLGGEEFSLGDIPFGVWAYRWFNLPIERPNQPNIENWYEQLKRNANPTRLTS